MVALTDTQYKSIIQNLLRGFGDSRPNPRVAAILTAEGLQDTLISSAHE